jgi:hypothetical protein
MKSEVHASAKDWLTAGTLLAVRLGGYRLVWHWSLRRPKPEMAGIMDHNQVQTHEEELEIAIDKEMRRLARTEQIGLSPDCPFHLMAKAAVEVPEALEEEQ